MNAVQKMKAWRDSLDLSQREAAERSEISQAVWSEYESGRSSSHTVDIVAAISRVTKGSPFEIAIEEWAMTPQTRAAKKRRADARKASRSRHVPRTS